MKMPMNAAIYARYSTDKQDARSTDDQIRRCRRYAAGQGYNVVAVYEDKAVSGAHAVRAALQRMLADAKTRGGSPFSAVLVDDQSRLARDLGTAWRLIFEDLPPHGVKVVDCTTGRASDETGARLTFGVTALMNDAFLEMVRTETHRGMEGRALTGFATGGRVFGYSTRKEANPPDPEHPRSEIVINEDEARLVQRMFAMWISGCSFKTIAIRFNEERIPAPHDGGTGNKGTRGWVPTTIRAMLMNDRYTGKITWNKTKWLKDRTTGKRRQIENPREEWVTVDRPDLRIIDDKTFQEAQARFQKRRQGPGRPAGITKRPSLIAGLIKCGKCGGSMTAISGKNKGQYRQYGCTTHYTRGESVCPNGMTISESKAAEKIVEAIRLRFRKPAVAEDIARLFERQAVLFVKALPETSVTKQLAAAERKVRNLYDAVANLGYSDGLKAAIQVAETDVAELRELARKETRRTGCGRATIPVKRVQACIERILETLSLDVEAARRLLLRRVPPILLIPTDEGYKFEAEWEFELEEEPAAPAAPAGCPAGVVGNHGSGGRI